MAVYNRATPTSTAPIRRSRLSFFACSSSEAPGLVNVEGRSSKSSPMAAGIRMSMEAMGRVGRGQRFFFALAGAGLRRRDFARAATSMAPSTHGARASGSSSSPAGSS